jgi:hypothetical protein
VHPKGAARIAAIVTLALAGACWLGFAIAGDAPHIGTADALHPLTAAAAAGKHLRIDGPHGPIHVWIPPSYRAETGATIVYLHGYYATQTRRGRGITCPSNSHCPRSTRCSSCLRRRPRPSHR